MRSLRLLGVVGFLGGALAAIHCGSDESASPGATDCVGVGCASKDGSVDDGDAGPAVEADAGPADEGGVCGLVDVPLTRTLPQVLFLLDQSSSMFLYKFPGESLDSNRSNNCASGCRWTALKEALVGTADTAGNGGAVQMLQGQARMAIALYSATDANANDDDNSFLPAIPVPALVCPRFGGKSFATMFPNGLSFSDRSFPDLAALVRSASVDDDAPTGHALQAVVGLDDVGTPNDAKGFAAVSSNGAPKVIVLVTDGAPGNCVSAQYSDNATTPVQQAAGAAKTLAVVQQAYAQQIRTFVVDIGGASLVPSFKAIANAGQGKDPLTGDASAYAPTSNDGLATTIQNIALASRTCSFALDGSIAGGKDATGTVKLGDTLLAYDVDWHLKNPGTVELLGDSCAAVKADPDARVSALFPCTALSIGK